MGHHQHRLKVSIIGGKSDAPSVQANGQRGSIPESIYFTSVISVADRLWEEHTRNCGVDRCQQCHRTGALSEDPPLAALEVTDMVFVHHCCLVMGDTLALQCRSRCHNRRRPAQVSGGSMQRHKHH